MGWYSSATMIGRFLAPFAGGMLIFGSDFRWVYLADGLIGLLTLTVALRLPLATTVSGSIREIWKREGGKYRQEIIFLAIHAGILATSAVEAVQYFAFGCIEVFLPIYLSEKYGYPAWQIGLLFTAQVLAAALTKPIMGRLSDRYGRVPLIVSGLALGGITTGTMILTSSFPIILVLIAIFGLGLATVTASTSAMVADFSRSRSRGGALGILSAIMDIGHSSGPIAAGFLISVFSYPLAFGLVGTSLVAVGLVFGTFMHRSLGSGGSAQAIPGM
jgi:MFS transporter, DHA1 family, multidrug resistance protein